MDFQRHHRTLDQMNGAIVDVFYDYLSLSRTSAASAMHSSRSGCGKMSSFPASVTATKRVTTPWKLRVYA